jgi:hypothetical protein
MEAAEEDKKIANNKHDEAPPQNWTSEPVDNTL